MLSLHFLLLDEGSSTETRLPTVVPIALPQSTAPSAAVQSRPAQGRPRCEWRTDENGRLVCSWTVDGSGQVRD
jgi:hypothetical protein